MFKNPNVNLQFPQPVNVINNLENTTAIRLTILEILVKLSEVKAEVDGISYIIQNSKNMQPNDKTEITTYIKEKIAYKYLYDMIAKGITEEDLKKQYEESTKQMKDELIFDLYAIILSPEDGKGKSIKAQGNDIINNIKKVKKNEQLNKFKEYAKTLSYDKQTGKSGGHLGGPMTGKMLEQFFSKEDVFFLKNHSTGIVSKVITVKQGDGKSEFGFVLFINAKDKYKEEPYESVKKELEIYFKPQLIKERLIPTLQKLISEHGKNIEVKIDGKFQNLDTVNSTLIAQASPAS